MEVAFDFWGSFCIAMLIYMFLDSILENMWLFCKKRNSGKRCKIWTCRKRKECMEIRSALKEHDRKVK